VHWRALVRVLLRALVRVLLCYGTLEIVSVIIIILLLLLVGRQEGHPAYKKYAGMGEVRTG